MPGRQKGGVSGRLHVDSAGRFVDGDAGMAPELSHSWSPTELKGKGSAVGIAPNVSEYCYFVARGCRSFTRHPTPTFYLDETCRLNLDGCLHALHDSTAAVYIYIKIYIRTILQHKWDAGCFVLS